MSEITETPAVRFSAEIDQLTAALAAAQLNYTSIVKDKFNPHTKSYYADLQSIVAATQPALAAEGLVIIQVPVVRNRTAGSFSRLAHKSGQFVESELLLPTSMPGKDDKFDAQSIGSAITYSKRYQMNGLTGAVAEDDDDGNAAADEQSNVSTPKQPKIVKAPPVSQKMSSQGGERPQDSVRTVPGTRTVTNTPALPSEPVTITLPASQTNDPTPAESSVVPKAVIPADTTPIQLPLTPVESTSSQTEQPDKKTDISGKPNKTQFDQYTARAILLKVPLEKAGLKPSKGVQTGTKLKNYLLASTGVKELSDLSITQWEDFFTQHEQAISAGQAEQIVAKIEGGK